MAQPAIAEAAVIAIPDWKWSGRPLVCIVVEPGQDAPVADALDGRLIRLGLAHWQAPDRFKLIGAVPRTSTGKFWKQTHRLRVLPRRLVVERIYNFVLLTRIVESATQVSKRGTAWPFVCRPPSSKFSA